MVRLATMNNSIEASLLKQQLENEGVRCFVTNEHSATILPHYGGLLGHGVQIMVSEDDYTKAQEIFERKIAEEKVTVCPYCGSNKIGFGIGGRKRLKKILAILLSLVFVIPMGNIRNRYFCKDCEENF